MFTQVPDLYADNAGRDETVPSEWDLMQVASADFMLTVVTAESLAEVLHNGFHWNQPTVTGPCGPSRCSINPRSIVSRLRMS
jgi:hypothetical protein